jgi:hypothetical protein
MGGDSTNPARAQAQKVAVTPLETSQVLVVVFANLCEGLNVNVLFPFLAFMVEDFGYEGHMLGYYAGFLAACFSGAQFFSSYFWGKASDIFGRKPAMTVGLLGAALGMLVFGTSRSYAQAVSGRLIAGFLSGNLGIIKTYLTEITDDTNRVNGFAYMSVASQIGNIMGPMAGGMLCDPAKQYPDYFSQTGVFATHPYLLPCLVCISMNLTAALVTTVFMRETRWARSQDVIEDDNGQDDPAMAAISVIELTPMKNALSSQSSAGDKRSRGEYTSLLSSSSSGDSEAGGTDVEDPSLDDFSAPFDAGDAFFDDDDDEGNVGTPSDTRSLRTSTRSESSSTLTDGGLSEYHKLEHGLSSSSLEDSEAAPSSSALETVEGESEDDTTPTLRQREVVLSTLTYGVLCMGYVILDETLPLFLKQDIASGGFAFRSNQIGFLLSSTGAVMLVFTLTLLPAVSRQEKLKLFRWANMAATPLMLLWPFVAYCNQHYFSQLPDRDHSAVLWACLLVMSTMKNMFASFTFTAVSTSNVTSLLTF